MIFRALICLMAVCGNLDIPGGNIQANEPVILSLGKFVRADKIPSKPKEMLHAHHHTIPKLMTVPPAYFRKAVLEGCPYPVKAAYVHPSATKGGESARSMLAGYQSLSLNVLDRDCGGVCGLFSEYR